MDTHTTFFHLKVLGNWEKCLHRNNIKHRNNINRDRSHSHLIFSRISYFCEKNNVIPVNRAGFRKDRSTIDHLVKITTRVKKQFSERKSVLVSFFDVKKEREKKGI